MTAKLQTIDGLTMDPGEFYELAKHPTPELLADYAWLDLPDGASLEGYLWPANYRVLPDTTGEELVRLMLDRFQGAIEGRMNVPAERGMTFHEILTLASIVEREAILDEERAAHRRRLPEPARRETRATRLLQADPTVIYGNDTVQLDELRVRNWHELTSSGTSRRTLATNDYASPELTCRATSTTYHASRGSSPGPICTPTLASIDAALAPDTAEKLRVLRGHAPTDRGGRMPSRKTPGEHDANRGKYGYN